MKYYEFARNLILLTETLKNGSKNIIEIPKSKEKTHILQYSVLQEVVIQLPSKFYQLQQVQMNNKQIKRAHKSEGIH